MGKILATFMSEDEVDIMIQNATNFANSVTICIILLVLFIIGYFFFKLFSLPRSIDTKDFKDITLFEPIESKNALTLYKLKSNKYYLITILVSLLVDILIACINIFFILIPITLSIIAMFIVSRILRPYKQIYYTALKNDKIRHEERIRFKERQRLSAEIRNIPPKPPTAKLINESLELEKEIKNNP